MSQWKTPSSELTLFCRTCNDSSYASQGSTEPLCYRCGGELIKDSRADIRLEFIDGGSSNDSQGRHMETLKDGTTGMYDPKQDRFLSMSPSGQAEWKDKQEWEQMKAEQSKPTRSSPHTGGGSGKAVERIEDEIFNKLKYKQLPEDSEDSENLAAGLTDIQTVSDSVFVQRLLMVMKDNQYDRVIPKRKKGKLDGKNIWKAVAGQVNVFKQRQESQNKEYHVVLAVDCSGSMGGQKFNSACETAAFMMESLQKADIDVSVIAFNCVIRVVKSRIERRMTGSELIKRISNHYGSQHGNNNDFFALKQGFELLKADEYGKIFMVFSDGEPAACEDCLGEQYKEVDKKNSIDYLNAFIKSFPQVTMIGVGIGSHYVEKIYPKYILIDDLKDFKPKVLHALSKSIVRG